MPVIIVGADTTTGEAIVDRFAGPDREVRVFVTDPETGLAMRRRGLKVAIGDLSDDSHVAAACLHCFSAVLVMEAAYDDRERAFAAQPHLVFEAWAAATAGAGVRRLIWVGDDPPPETPGQEVAVVSSASAEIAEAVYRLDDAASLEGNLSER